MKNESKLICLCYCMFVVIAIMIIMICFGFINPVGAVSADNIPKHTDEFYVNDFANVFSKEQKDELTSKAKTFAETQTDGVQIVITTINSLDRSTYRRLC